MHFNNTYCQNCRGVVTAKLNKFLTTNFMQKFEKLSRAEMKNVLGGEDGGGGDGGDDGGDDSSQCGSACSGSCVVKSGVCKGVTGNCVTSQNACKCAAVCG
jgi:hypothetical protein